MSSSNVASAQRTTPFLCNIYGYNRSDKSRKDISQANDLGDLEDLAGTFAPVSKELYAVRMLYPHYSELTQAYLSLKITPGAGDSWSLKLAMGEFEQSGGASTYKPIESGYSGSYIDKWHSRLTNRDEAYTADSNNPVDIRNLQIAPALRQLSANQKYQEAFCLLLSFSPAPDVTSWDFTEFRIIASGEVSQ